MQSLSAISADKRLSFKGRGFAISLVDHPINGPVFRTIRSAFDATSRAADGLPLVVGIAD
jgi:hypothetical protein